MQNDARGRVLLVAPPGSYRVHAYLEAACDLGIAMLVVSEGAHALIPGFRDGLRVDFSDPDDVIRQIQRTHRDQPVTESSPPTTAPSSSRTGSPPLSGSPTTRRSPRASPGARTLPALLLPRPNFRCRRPGGWTCAVPLPRRSRESNSPAW